MSRRGHVSRRQFLKDTVAGAAVVAGTPALVPAMERRTRVPARRRRGTGAPISGARPTSPRRIRSATTSPGGARSGSAPQVQAVIINAGGIVAYYPSKFPLHHRAEFLDDRDLFGELTKAAHDDGLFVMARMDSNRTAEDFFKAHPDWFARDGDGQPYRAADKYVACINSPYYDEYLPDVLREIIERSHPDGFTDNSWAGLGREQHLLLRQLRAPVHGATAARRCRAGADWDDRPTATGSVELRAPPRGLGAEQPDDACRRRPRLHLVGHEQRIDHRAGALVPRPERDLPRAPTSSCSTISGATTTPDFSRTATPASACTALLGWDKLAPESMAMYQSGPGYYRVASKPEAEARMWMIAGIAGGIQPWWHHVGAYHEDRRMYRTPEPVMRWWKANERYLVDRTPVANVGVVWSQRNTDFFGRDDAGAASSTRRTPASCTRSFAHAFRTCRSTSTTSSATPPA